MFVTLVLFALGLVLLIKGGDWFVDGATGIAHHYHIPELLIGATIVSIGTTLPEVMVSATSAVTGHSEIAYGNAIGSVICNTSLIAALTVAISPSQVARKTLVIPVLFFFGAAFLYSIIACMSGYFSRVTGFVLLTIFAAYIGVQIWQAVKSRGEATDGAGTPNGVGKNIGWLVIGAVLIAIGAKLLVDNATLIAKSMGVPESVIGLTLVALGTSLPELVTAITALVKGHSSLSLGNIIGANLFNIVFVSGLATALTPFAVPAQKLIGGHNAALAVDTPVMLAVMVLLTVPTLIACRLRRWQGIVLLLIYAAYCTFQFIN